MEYKLDPKSLPDVRKTHNYIYPEHFRSMWDDFTQNVPIWKHYLVDKFKDKPKEKLLIAFNKFYDKL